MRSIKTGTIVFCLIIGLNLVHWSEQRAHAEEQPVQLQELAKVVGVEASVQQAKQAAEIKPVEVADKALPMIKGAVASVADTAAKVAPHVWRIMVKQQYIKAATDVMLPWSLFLLTVIAYLWEKKVWIKHPFEKDSDMATGHCVLQYCLPAIFWAIWGCIAIAQSVAYLLNPEYYAIRDLMLMALHPSSITQ